MWLRECVCMHVLYFGVSVAQRCGGEGQGWGSKLAGSHGNDEAASVQLQIPKGLRTDWRGGLGAGPATSLLEGGTVALVLQRTTGGGGPSTIPPRWNVCRAGGGLNGGDVPTPPSRPWGETFPDPPPWSSSGSQGLRDWLPVALLSHARQLGIHAHMHACAHACTRTRKPTGPPAHVVSVHACIPTYLRLHP